MEFRKCVKLLLVISLFIPAVCIADIDEWQQMQLLDPPQPLLMVESGAA